MRGSRTAPRPRRAPARAAGTLLLVGALASCGSPEAGRDALVIAHRGASGHAPEHTFAAWDRALEMGADVLEQDLQLTADGVLVVLHDATLDRTARGPVPECTGPVRQRTLAELRHCEVGSWFAPEFTGAPIPTLRQVLARYADRAPLYVETKHPQDAPGMETALLALLDELELDTPEAAAERRVRIQSFSAASLRRLHEARPVLPLVQLFGRRWDGAAIGARLPEVAGYAVGIGPHHEAVDRPLVRAAHARGLAVHPWTVNEPGEMRRLLTAWVDGIFTDFPDRLVAVRAGLTGAPGDPSAPE